MEIRLLGDEAEVASAAGTIRQAFNVTTEGGPYHNRHDEGVRLYLTVASGEEIDHGQKTQPDES